MSEYAAGPIKDVDPDIQAMIPEWGVLHALVWYVTKTSDAPPEHVIGAILPALAHAMAVRGLYVDQDAQHVPHIWLVLVGDSGVGKSTAIDRVMTFYRQHLRETTDPYVDPYSHVEGSIPGLLETLADKYDETLNRTSTVLYNDEFTRILESSESVSEVLCILADSKRDFTRNLRKYHSMRRKGQKTPDTVRSPAISAIFATTMSGLENTATSKQATGGLFARPLWLHANLDKSRLRFEEILAPDARKRVLALWRAWAGALDGTLLLAQKDEMEIVERTTPTQTIQQRAGARPTVIVIPSEVKVFLKDFFEECVGAMVEGSSFNGLLRRAEGRARMIASIYAFSRGELTPSSDDVIRAIRLVKRSLQAVGLVQDSVAVDPGFRQQERALRIIQATGSQGMLRGELYSRLKLGSKQEMDRLIETLLDRGDAMAKTTNAGKRGRPGTRFFTTSKIIDLDHERKLRESLKEDE